MNYPYVEWINGTSSSVSGGFFDATPDSFQTQHVVFPTHKTNIIDLVLLQPIIFVLEEVGSLSRSYQSIL